VAHSLTLKISAFDSFSLSVKSLLMTHSGILPYRFDDSLSRSVIHSSWLSPYLCDSSTLIQSVQVLILFIDSVWYFVTLRRWLILLLCDSTVMIRLSSLLLDDDGSIKPLVILLCDSLSFMVILSRWLALTSYIRGLWLALNSCYSFALTRSPPMKFISDDSIFSVEIPL